MTTTADVPWIGTDPAWRVAASVPADVVRAIEAYETARARRARANANYMLLRSTGDRDAAQDALDECKTHGRLAEWWWQRLGDLLPMEAGWWPHGSHVYGYAKVGRGGLELVRRRGWSAWPDRERAGEFARRMRRREEEEGRSRAFCESHRRG